MLHLHYHADQCYVGSHVNLEDVRPQRRWRSASLMRSSQAKARSASSSSEA